MDDEQDVKRMTEFLDQVKQENIDDDFEYDHYNISDDSDEDGVYIDEEGSNIEDEYDFPEPVTLDIVDLCRQDPVATFKECEKQIINNCTDSTLKQLLILNRKKNLYLTSLHSKVKDLLVECRQNIANKADIIMKVETADRRTKTMQTGVWKIGSPYFKDQDLFKAPANVDVIKKHRNQELLVYAFNPIIRWKPIECERLVKFVKLEYNLNQQKEIVNKIQKILAGTTESEKQKQNQIGVLQKQLAELKNKEHTEYPPRFSDEHINWNDVSKMFVKVNHTDQECRTMWNMFLHPQLNKGSWTSVENNKLKQLVKKYNYQNWDLIAEKLETNRSSLQLCSRFYRYLHCPNKKGEFSHEEDVKLVELVAKFQVGDYIPWTKITRMFDNTRNRPQLYHRYMYYLSQTKKQLGKFTLAEDAMLMICVDRFGRVFRKCQQYLPNRTIAQCKSRYSTHCFGDLKKGSFDVEEDEIILKHAERFGTRCWSVLSEILKRSTVQIRQRYMTIQLFLNLSPQATIYDMVRRAKKRIVPMDVSYQLARNVANHFKNHNEIPTLTEIQQILQEKYKDRLPHSSDSDSNDDDVKDNIVGNEDEKQINELNVDSLLMDFFNNSYRIKETSNISKLNIKKAVYDVQKCLEVLQADLHIPDPADIKDDIRLDKLDAEILQHISQGNAGTHRGYLSTAERSKNICQSLPPNTYTALGMRSLLIKHLDLEKRRNFREYHIHGKDLEEQETVMKKISDQLSTLDPLAKDLVDGDRNLFFHRFQSIFKNAALLTLENPSPDLISVSNNVEREVLRPEVRRTFGKVKKKNSQDTADNNKRMKLSDDVTYMPSNLTLIPVKGKSVIEELMKNKEKKLYRMDKINEGGKIRTVVKEVTLALDSLPNIPGTSRSPSCKQSTNPIKRRITETSTRTNSVSDRSEDDSSSRTISIYEEDGSSTRTNSLSKRNKDESCTRNSSIHERNEDESSTRTNSISKRNEDESSIRTTSIYERNDDASDTRTNPIYERNEDDVADLMKLDKFLKEENSDDSDDDI